VTTDAIRRGTVLGGRYRLDDLLSENDGARFWRGSDTVLGRSVAVNVLPVDDPRLPGLLAAARDSARVTDARLLHVLDCAEDDAVGWVVNEWGEGASLDILLQQGPLPPARAAWLAHEVAALLVVAHREGVAHGRLAPEAVLVTGTGSAKVIGFAVSAAIEGSGAGSANAVKRGYGELDPFEADVIDLAGVLYASLTGRWPGLAPSAIPPAPYDARGPLRPRQVRAGVPRMLDAVCERVLRKEAHEHLLPLESAYEVFAALTEHLGDVAAAEPQALAQMHEEPAPPGDLDRLRGAIAGAARVNRYQRQGPGAFPSGIQPSVPLVDPDEPAAPPPPAAAPTTPPVSPLPAYGGFDPYEQPAPLPPFVDSPERPLFADTLGAPTPRPEQAPTPAGWPFEGDAPPEHHASSHAERVERAPRRWPAILLVSLLFTVVVVVGLILLLGS